MRPQSVLSLFSGIAIYEGSGKMGEVVNWNEKRFRKTSFEEKLEELFWFA